MYWMDGLFYDRSLVPFNKVCNNVTTATSGFGCEWKGPMSARTQSRRFHKNVCRAMFIIIDSWYQNRKYGTTACIVSSDNILFVSNFYRVEFHVFST